MDAMKLVSAYCMYEGLSQAAEERRQNRWAISYGHLQEKPNVVPPAISSVGEKTFDLFRKALQSGPLEVDRFKSSSSSARKINLAGHDLVEARTEDDFLELAKKFIPTESGRLLVNGAQVHGLLVMERVIPYHWACYQYIDVLTQLLFMDREVLRTTIGLTGLFPVREEQESPTLSSFQLLQHFLQCICEKMPPDALYDVGIDRFINGPLCSAASMASQLISINVFVGTTHIFEAMALPWRHHQLLEKQPCRDCSLGSVISC